MYPALRSFAPLCVREQVARGSVDSSLLRFGAKGHLLLAALCALCYQPPDAVRERLERYKDLDVNFDGSRECKLVEVRGQGEGP